MFTKKDASLVIDILKSVMPEELVNDPDIIVAGGVALNLYMIQLSLESMNPAHRAIPIRTFLRTPMIKFSDVDLWITKESNSNYAKLFENVPSTKENRIGKEYEVGNTKLKVLSRSDWATTYSYSRRKNAEVINYSTPIQCIVKHQNSAEELISSFDLGICSVAIYRGEFIVHETLLKSLNDNELCFNNSNDRGKSFASKAYNTLRCFKYYEKTGFDFSKDVYSDVLSVMYDASLFWNEFETTAGSKIGQSIKITTNSNYEQEIISKENVVGMVQSLATNFVKLQKMKHWDMSNALFMPKSKLFDNITKMIIKNNFDKIEAKADTSLQKGTVDSSINFDDVFSELD
jgi:hypothetical protein